ncbi:S9 family peptidase [Sphingomonas naphthae]|uniref:S9 family peptidase n=1 Tax=Sphingomonas naphthae TaxID=1813468 RepID=A0ABY7TQJ6_9SPHN|nr:S9 family peptidase [Sphingomonas naphthae]WCT75511.1 S9 family peptidase [Sphingomonas naphthae]
MIENEPERSVLPLPTPPVAPTKPHSFTHHGITVEDPWAWLKDPNYPTVTNAEVLDYLAQENAFFEAAMAPHQATVDALFAEMKGRLKEDDSSVPQKDGDWLYWWAFRPGAQYRCWWRRPVAGGGADELILDEPALAEGKDYFRLGALAVSPDGRFMAWSVDDNGSERFTLRVRDLIAGADLPDTIPGTLGGVAWQADSAAFAYGLVNDQWRVDVAQCHRLGGDVAEDVVLYREADEGFRISIGQTQSRRFVVLSAGDHVTSEVRLLPGDDLTGTPILVSPRIAGREYEVDEHEGTLLIRTNDAHVNFRVATAPLAAPGDWAELIPGSDDFYIRGLTAFADFFTVEGRERGLDQIVLHDHGSAAGRRVAFPEASYTASLANNPEYAVDRLRLSYQSMVTPPTVYDFHVGGRGLESLKVQEIPSGYDPAKYRTERVEIAARDGTAIPVSIVYPADFAKDGSGPLHLYGYGAYGLAIPPGFSTSRLSLLDRGFAFAIAHIRGGDDLGYHWYLDGKLEKRTNTFDDFVDVAKGLVAEGWASPGRVTASGGSAGGELMGAIINQAPELWGAVVAHVPFVDVLNTMLDASLPLTPGEWPEWGNPIEDKAAFELIRSYSPYDQVSAQDYPPLLIIAGLNDPRVTYWEPAKWAAKLRATRTGDAILLLKTNMGAGHGGKSGRFDSLREVAEEYAFLLWQLGVG